MKEVENTAHCIWTLWS